MSDDEEVSLAVPRWMIARVRAARVALERADAAFADVSDRGERLAAEAERASADEETRRAEAMLLREVLALASKQGV
jgi:hypothetical protein